MRITADAFSAAVVSVMNARVSCDSRVVSVDSCRRWWAATPTSKASITVVTTAEPYNWLRIDNLGPEIRMMARLSTTRG